MSRERRREMVERGHRVLSTVRQCALLGISRSSLNYRRKVTYPEDLAVMKAMDQQYLSTPFYGSRRMRAWLGRQGQTVNRKRVQRLMRTMGLRAIYRRPRTSKPGPRHKVYPYLLGGMEIARPNQVWAADITYIPMAKGFLYLVAIMDWYSRYVVAWRLSNTLDAAFCVEVLDEALRKGKPEVFNTDQGGQFTSEGFIGLLKQHGVSISMDGKGRYSDNIFIERLWRTVKYEEVYLKAYSGGREAKAGLDAYFSFYNNQRPHQALGYRTPAEVFNGGLAPSDERPINGKWTPSRVLADLGKTAGLSLNIAPNLSNSWGQPQNAEHDNAPENGEWHELGHHIFSLNIGDGWDGSGFLCDDENVPPCGNHDGYLNPVTQDSMDEAFAAFIGGIAWAFIEEGASLTGDLAGLDPGGVDDTYSDFGSMESNGWKPWYDPDWADEDEQHTGEESAFTALLWDLWDDNPDVHITEVKANFGGDHEPVFLVDEISLTLQQTWAALDAVDPALDPTVAGFREQLIALLPDKMSALTVDLDGDNTMDVAPIDIPFLMHGFYPLEADEYAVGHRHYYLDIEFSFEDVTERNGLVGRTDSLHPLTGVDRSPRRHPEIPVESSLLIDVAGLSAEQLAGTKAVVTLVYPESTVEYTYLIDSPIGNIIPLRLPPHYSGVLLDADATPACNRDEDYNVFVAVQVTVPSIGHDGLARFDNCEFITAVRAAAGGAPAMGLAFTFDPDGPPPPPTTGETLNVTTTVDSADGTCGDHCSLREAIIFANSVPGHDTILVPTGTYPLTLIGEAEDNAALGDLDIKDDLTIIGDGAEATIIDGIQKDRVFHTFPNIQVVFDGLRITGGRALNAGGIAIDTSDVTIRNSIVSGNASISASLALDADGGGIYNLTGTLLVEDSTVSSNTSVAPLAGGAGVHTQGPNSTTSIVRSTIANNTASPGNGGGIFAAGGGVLSLSHADILNNTALGEGGGILARDHVVSIADSNVSDNTAGDGFFGVGGGLYAPTSDVTIERSSFERNQSASGGGIAFYDGPQLTIHDSNISANNVSTTGGGIIFVIGLAARNNELEATTFSMTGTTVSDNDAGNGTGGGIGFNVGNVETTAVIENSVISGNTAFGGGGISGHILDSLTIRETELINNTATAGPPFELPVFGGGGIDILVTEAFFLEDSLVSGNSAPLAGGGGIFVSTVHPTRPSFADIVNTTFSGNSAKWGGAIFVNKGTTRVNNSTLSSNISDLLGDAVYAATGTGIFYKGTIIEGLEGSINCAGEGHHGSFGYNIESEDTCGLTVSTDLPSTDPLLEPLQNLGGPTNVHPLSPDSPALNALPVIDCDTIGAAPIPIEHDQRGAPRPEQPGSFCDIGAYEDNVLPFLDIDGDGVPRSGDNCSLLADIDQADDDGDGIGNPCEPDTDSDGVIDDFDNCVFIPNPEQTDTDEDGAGDECDNNPVVDFGGPYELFEGETIQLDASGTSDADGDELTFAWDLDDDDVFGEMGLAAENGDELGATPIFDATNVNGAGFNYWVELHVSDGVNTVFEDVPIVVLDVLPLLTLLGDSVMFDNPATLGVSWTDPAIDQEIYAAQISWGESFPEFIDDIASPINIQHTYSAPGTYSVRFELIDFEGLLAAATTTIFVTDGGNLPPVASAGPPYFIPEGSTLALDGSGSFDPDGSISAYEWDLDNDGNFDDATGVAPNFDAANLDGVVSLQFCQ